ncbi:MAG: hypothetical protein QM766_03770 [Burkholderiaceae bacterium]
MTGNRQQMTAWRKTMAVCAAMTAGATPAFGNPSSLPWAQVFESPESSIHLLREAPESVPPDRNPTTRIWYLEDRKIARMLGLLTTKTYSSQIQRWEVDCRARAYRMSGAVYFEGHMGSGKALRTAAPRQGYEIAPANPLMNAIFNATCGSNAIRPLTAEQRAQLPQLP